jgi:transcriptional regulator with XRE-family HTH domain
MHQLLRKAVGANVRSFRLKLNLSQEKLAEKAGFHWTYISGVERGRYNISLDSLERLASAVGKKPYELLK